MQLMMYAIVVFAISAVGGTYMAMKILNGKLAPWMVSMVHLALGVVGLGLVGMAVMAGVGGTPGLLTLGVLTLAAVGGLALLLPMHLKKVVAPAWVVIVHASVGTIGFLMIILVAFVLNVTPDLADPNAVAPNLR